MCTGVALPEADLPLDLVERHDLRRRLHRRAAGECEFRFLYRDAERVLPVWHQGRLIIAQWGGSRRGRLPPTGWTWQATVDAGGWGPFDAEPVTVPCALALEKGVWFGVREGVRAVLAADERGRPCAFLICEPSTRYYRVMTRSERMPVLVDEVI